MDVIAGSLGAAVKFFIIILGLLIGLLLIAIIKLIRDKNLTLKHKLIMGLVTPISIIIGLIISKYTGDGDINGIIVLALIILTLIYLSKPISEFITEFLYDGSNLMIKGSVFWCSSVIVSLIELTGFFGIIIWMMKE